MKLKMVISEGMEIPEGYGVAYSNAMYTYVCYPIPLNILFGYVHEMMEWVRHGGWRRKHDKARIEGYMEGYVKGFDAGVKSMDDMVVNHYINVSIDKITKHFKEDYR